MGDNVPRPASGTVTEGDFTKVVNYLMKLDRIQIVRLGSALGLSVYRLEKMHTLPDDMVRSWMRRDDEVKEVTWGILVKMLREKIRNSGIADDIESNECTEAAAATPTPLRDVDGREGQLMPTQVPLLGVLVDTSGSMKTALPLTQLDSQSSASLKDVTVERAQAALSAIINLVKKKQFQEGYIFVGAFGLKTPDQTHDLLSLLEESQNNQGSASPESDRPPTKREKLEYTIDYLGAAIGLFEPTNPNPQITLKSRKTKEVSELLDKLFSPSEASQRLLHDKIKETLRSIEGFLFGITTPMCKALREAGDVFRKKPDTSKTLFVLSDGQSNDGDPILMANNLHSSGVTIVTCFLTSDHIPNPKCLYNPNFRFSDPARQALFEMSSIRLNSQPPISYLTDLGGWKLSKTGRSRLFIQANSLDVVNMFCEQVVANI